MKPQVVITRKDKRINKTGHLLAFMLTGGASSIYTASKVASNASYNARTRQLQNECNDDTPRPPRIPGPVERQIIAERNGE